MRLLAYVALWIGPVAASAYKHALARLVNTTIHSTHPLVRYSPETACSEHILGACISKRAPFTLTTYVDGNLKKRAFHHANSQGNNRQDPRETRSVEIEFYGREAYVYGPPRGQLNHLPGELKISVDGWHVANINLEKTFESADPESHDPHLTYHWRGDGTDKHHTIRLSLCDDADGAWPWAPIRTFGFDSLVVTKMERRESGAPRSRDKTLQSVIIHDTNYQVLYYPHDAWKRKEYPLASSAGFRTFHEVSVSGELDRVPVVEFTAQCSAIDVYGAPYAYFESKRTSDSQHRPAQVCIAGNCDYIDTHQAYLNIPREASNEPVLLYSTGRALPDGPFAVSIQSMDDQLGVGKVWNTTFSHAICWKIQLKRPWLHPVVDGIYSTRVVHPNELVLKPSELRASSWKVTDQYGIALVRSHAFSHDPMNLPSWSTTLRGYDIRIYVPILSLTSNTRYADVECCLDGECHHPDIEQWFIKATSPKLDLPLVHYKDLNPFEDHTISMTALPPRSGSSDAIFAISQVVYEEVTVEPQSSREPDDDLFNTDSPRDQEPNLPRAGTIFDSSLLKTISTILLLCAVCLVGKMNLTGHAPCARTVGTSLQAGISEHITQSASGPDESSSDDLAVRLPDPPTDDPGSAGLGNEMIGSVLSPGLTEFSFGSTDFASTPPEQNSLELSGLINPFIRARRPLTPIIPNLDYDSPGAASERLLSPSGLPTHQSPGDSYEAIGYPEERCRGDPPNSESEGHSSSVNGV